MLSSVVGPERERDGVAVAEWDPDEMADVGILGEKVFSGCGTGEELLDIPAVAAVRIARWHMVVGTADMVDTRLIVGQLAPVRRVRQWG